jgi:superfamily I DNA/RNA helicase
MKAIVAIDEATDFTPIQIACMSHLSHPRYNSVTLCGDIMQQMNNRGMTAWDDYKALFSKTEIHNLYKSYRQTPTLLNLASELYKNRYGRSPEFIAAAPSIGKDPIPLIYSNPDFEEKIDWIAKRIEELYVLYERIIPNIAIFVRDESSLVSIADSLNKHERMIDNNIVAMACRDGRDIGSAEKVRIFNIEYIKGMEFESVFFIDVDTYSAHDEHILDKLVYVGISRATYYLAITLMNKMPDILKPIEHLFREGGWLDDNDSDY